MVQCFAPDCNHRSERETCSFFRFPSEVRQIKDRMKWIALTRRQDKEPKKHSRICSSHFRDSKRENGPEVYCRNKDKLFEPEKPKSKGTKRLKVPVPFADHVSEPNTDNVPDSNEQSIIAITEIILLEHDVNLLTAKTVQLQNELVYISTRYSVNKLSDSVLRMETGLPTRNVFNTLFNYVNRFKTRIVYRNGWNVETTNISLQDQLFITLMKVRQNYPYLHIAQLFGCSSTTVSNIVMTFDNIRQQQKKTEHEGIPSVIIKPNPGMCMKTRTANGEKVFINICYSENVPEPNDLTDDELLKVLESEDPTKFRIPMSIGEPHAELDKSGGGCTVYDVVVNPNFLAKIKKSELFKTFFLTIMCEGIESKYDVLLKRDWIFLKNRKSIGKLIEQHIRTKSSPLIVDMEGDQLPVEQPEKRNLIEEIYKQDEELNKKAPEPVFSIIQEPAEGYPEFLVAEISLPNIKTAESLTLNIGEDRLLLTTRSHVYYMDVFLPFDLLQYECGAQFNRESKILTVTMPVKPK